MKKVLTNKYEWSAFRITALLYAVVLIIPLIFYFVHSSFENIQEDSKITRDVAWANGVMDAYTSMDTKQPTPQALKKLDRTFQSVRKWVETNKNSKFYLGSDTLEKDFMNAKICWDQYKQSLQGKASYDKKRCRRIFKNLSLIITNMIELKQRDLINMFYWNLTAAMLLSILMIYFIRVYIQMQLNRHSVYDLETNLYNHNYFNEHMKTTCARAARYKYPLSLLSISINGIDKKSLDEKEYAKFMETVGDILLTMTRTSDVACRYDEDHIAIILPFTEDKNAEILKGRIQETFEKHNFNISETPTFVFSIVQYEPQETAKEYIERAEKVLREH